MTQLPGFKYDAKRRRAVLDGYVAGTQGKIRRQQTVKNVTRDQALAAWKAFRADLESGRAIEGPLTLKEFVARYYDKIAANHAPGTKKTQSVLIKAHLVRYFGEDELSSISSIRVVDFIADMRGRGCAASYINDAVRVLKMLLRQAVERDVIADYPIKKRVPKEREVALRLELNRDERARFFATFDDEAAFRACVSAKRKLGPEKASAHFFEGRRFGGGMRGDSEAAGAYFTRFRDLRDYFIVAAETGLRVFTDLRDLRWSSINFASGFIRVVTARRMAACRTPCLRIR